MFYCKVGRVGKEGRVGHDAGPPCRGPAGGFKGPHPVPGGGRILQALRTGGAGK
jgi:hypothetical protein